jgi:hypothetical protein
VTATFERAMLLAADRLEGRDAASEKAAQYRLKRQTLLEQCPTPSHLAARFDATYVRTEAVDLVARELRDAVTEYDGKLVVSVPPQEMKTTLLRWLGFWLLLNDPERRVVYASYAASLARSTGRAVRTLIQTYGGQFGLEIDYGHADASDWELAGHGGGMVTTGVGGALTGRPADVLIVDDPLRNQQDADSVTIRENVYEWWSSVALTRLAPGAPAVVVQTRWEEDDLAGRRLAEGWRGVNIPALADGKTEDALGREPGTWLVSARGRTADDWVAKRKAVGERTFGSLYQGRPAPLEGGVFKRAWFDLWRVDEAPAGCLPPVVVVDPADNPGSGDEAGIVVGCAHPGSGKGYLLDDLSGAMTVGKWARLALLTCVRRQAPTLAFEKSLSQLTNRIRESWTNLHQQAIALHRTDGDLDAAVARMSRADDSTEITERIRGELAEIVDDVVGILGFGQTGPRIKGITAKGTKTARMLLVAPTFETGRMVLVGRHGVFEHQAATWQEGQDSPDRVDAGVHLTALLLGVSGVASLSRADERVPTTSTGLRRTGGSSRIGRSTGR